MKSKFAVVMSVNFMTKVSHQGNAFKKTSGSVTADPIFK